MGKFRGQGAKHEARMASRAAKWQLWYDERRRKRDTEIERQWKRTGLMNGDGLFNPYAIRLQSLGSDQRAEMSTGNNLKLGVGIGVGAVVLAAILTAYVLKDNGGTITPPANHDPSIDSWNLVPGDNGAYTLFANGTDDGRISTVYLQVEDASGKQVYSNNWQPDSKQVNLKELVDLSGLPAGTYKAKLQFQDNQGAKSPRLEKMIDVSDCVAGNDLPEIVGEPDIRFDNATEYWHFKANATDKNCDGEYILITFVERSTGQGLWDRKYFNTAGKPSWIAEDDIKLNKGINYRLEAYAVDKSGNKSKIAFKDFDY